MARQVDWRGVVGTTLHPTQVQILEATALHGRLSPVQFCDHGAELSRVAYHFRALHKLGLLESAGTAGRRGAIQHFYRLSRIALREHALEDSPSARLETPSR
jgi:hypothetical protein